MATVMAADPVDPEELAAQARNAPLTRPRPGHADLAGMQKYGHTDARPILERASARETAARVAVGVVAKALVKQALGIEIVSHVIELGSVAAKAGPDPGAGGRRPDRRRPAALPRPRGQRPDGRRGRRGEEGRGHARRHRRGAGLRRAAGPGLARAVGPQAGRPAGHRADVDPVGQGRGDRRRLHPGPLARLGRARRDHPDRGRASGGSPTGPAAWRAASPTASRCGSAPR